MPTHIYPPPANHYSIEVIDPNRDPEWDAFVETHPHGWVCHTSAWLKVVQHVWKNLKPYYIIARDDEKKISAGIPLCLLKSLTGKKRLISTPFSTLTDPLATDDRSLVSLLSKIPDLMEQENISSVVFKTFQATNSIPTEIYSRSDKHIHHALDLTLSEEQLMSSFHRSNRKSIKKSLKSPLTINYASSLIELKRFYDLYLITRKRLGLPVIPWSFFEGMWNFLKDCNWIDLLNIFYNDTFVGGMISLKYHNSISAEVLAYKPEFLTMCPNNLLIWSTILNAKKEGRQEFDFGRTDLSEQGIMKFKDQWTMKKTLLPTFRYPKMNGNSSQKEEAGSAMKLMRSMIQNQPMPIYKSASKLFYARPR